MNFKKDSKLSKIFVLILVLVICVLFFIPTGYEKANNEENIYRCKGEVIKVDNSDVIIQGIVKRGEQRVTLSIKDKPFKGRMVESVNMLIGQMEFDKYFKVGDSALLVIKLTKNDELSVNIIDHYRINIELILIILFCCCLIILAGWTGIKSILSFVFSILVIWKVLLPSFLKGYNPIIVSILVAIILSFVIIFLVAGFTKKGVVAFVGALSGELLTCILALIFGNGFNIHGSVIPFAETLLYSGFANIDITGILLAGIFLASSGAVMDVAMDISSALNELVEKNPDINCMELIKSGINVSRAIIGTMTTTLLLAYSGGYTALLMTFIAQGTPFVNIINIKYVSSEILHTLVGSFGLIMVAPFTSVIGGVIYSNIYKK